MMFKMNPLTEAIKIANRKPGKSLDQILKELEIQKEERRLKNHVVYKAGKFVRDVSDKIGITK